MAGSHHNEPRDIGYSKHHAYLFQSWLAENSETIFAGKKQRDLLIFAMALGRDRNEKSEVKDKQANVPVSNIPEKLKWAILCTSIADKNDLSVLKDENEIYKDAERYGEEGLKILQSHIKRYGINYPYYLERELMDRLREYGLINE